MSSLVQNQGLDILIILSRGCVHYLKELDKLLLKNRLYLFMYNSNRNPEVQMGSFSSFLLILHVFSNDPQILRNRQPYFFQRINYYKYLMNYLMSCCCQSTLSHLPMKVFRTKNFIHFKKGQRILRIMDKSFYLGLNQYFNLHFQVFHLNYKYLVIYSFTQKKVLSAYLHYFILLMLPLDQL